MTSPTQRTLKACKDQGWIAGVTERYVDAIKQRFDLFGFIDIVAITDNQTIGIQCTSGSNMANRITKIREECADAARAWLAAGNRIQVWGWKKYKKRVDGRWWQPRIVELTSGEI